MLKYTKDQIEKLYDENPNTIGKIFLSAGYNEDYIEKMLNNSKKDIVVLRTMKIIEKLQETNDFYEIPEKYKKAEIPDLQEDRNNIYNEVNNIIDVETGKILEQLWNYENNNYMIGIHRTASPADSILSKGIEYSEYPNIHDHVQMFENFPFRLREIMHCENYKLSNKCFIIKVPKSSIKGNIDNAEPIFYKNSDGKIYLRPEFIAAYVPVQDKKLRKVRLNKLNHDDIYNVATEFYQDENVTINQRKYGFINIIFLNVIIMVILILFLVFF